ncbi:MAG: histidine kinase dimerization/phospho-acceptor domain-containing protein, partial [Victivallis sp.]
ELRTPLNAVIGFSELLQTGGVEPAEQKEYLRSINFAGTALLNLINDVLDLSKLEAEQMNMLEARTDVASLVAETTSVFRLKAQEKDLF